MKEFKITKEQILELKNTLHKERVDYLLNEYFPDAFRTTLEVNKWYKDNNSKLLYFILEIKDVKNINAYGFDARGNYCESKSDYEWGTPDSYTEANNKEVETALINEAKKRGFLKGIYFDNSILKDEDFGHGNQIKKEVHFSECDNGTIWCHSEIGYNRQLFRNGIWATIIPTITKQEAEEKLNCKIV